MAWRHLEQMILLQPWSLINLHLQFGHSRNNANVISSSTACAMVFCSSVTTSSHLKGT